ncbi:MAG: hypothetical protein OXI49_18290 [Acidobacteriota bacterium]|nr:hypothetical protein [Acidobacteriota bacterium]
MTEPAPRPPQDPTARTWLQARDCEAPISSNVGAGDLPFQRWFRFKEAYSPALVAQTIATCDYPVRHILDPFGGSGTTALTARMEGLDSTSIEVNPFLADLIRAKVTPVSATSFAETCRRIVEQTNVLENDYNIIDAAPATLVEPGVNNRYIYARETYGALRALNRHIAQLEVNESRLARVLLGSILVDCSNAIVNGKGRRYRRNWQARSVTRADVFERFDAAVTRAVEDLKGFARTPPSEHCVFNDDARKRLELLAAADLAVFSPPYLNSFDYTDVYNLELWMLDYLRSGADNKRLRARTLRSHVQIRWPSDKTAPATPKLLATKTALDERREALWNRNIPDMVVGYFTDLQDVLVSLSRILPERAYVVAAIGDSQYGGVRIDTAGILTEIAKKCGYEVETASKIRSLRASAQHGGRFDLAETVVRLRNCETKGTG